MDKSDDLILDRKFEFSAINPVNHKRYSHKDGVLFLAKDNHMPTVLQVYLSLVENENGKDSDEAESIRLLIKRVRAYRRLNKDKCKAMDLDEQEKEVLLAPNPVIAIGMF